MVLVMEKLVVVAAGKEDESEMGGGRSDGG